MVFLAGDFYPPFNEINEHRGITTVDFYREQILDHYRNPRNWGRLKKPHSTASVYNEFCGDKIILDLAVSGTGKNPKKLKVDKIAFKGDGCAISIASASMLTEMVKDKSIWRLQKILPNDIVSLLGIKLNPTRLKCALLPLEVLHKALKERNFYG